MKLFNFKKAPVETGPPGNHALERGNDGSKLPIPGFLTRSGACLSPGGGFHAQERGLVIEEGIVPLQSGIVPSLIPGSSDDDDNPLVYDHLKKSRIDDITKTHRVPVNSALERNNRLVNPAGSGVKFEKGETIVIEGCKFKIVYIRSNPSRMTLEAV